MTNLLKHMYMGKLQNRTQERKHQGMNILVQTMSNNIKSNQNNINLSSWCLPQICQQLQVLNDFKNVALAIVIERPMKL